MDRALREKPKKAGDPAFLGCLGGNFFFGVNAYDLAAVTGFELNNAVNFGKDGIVFAKANVKPGVNFGPPLADDDVASFYKLAAITLNP